MLSVVNSASSRRLSPQPSKIANIARFRFPVSVSLSGCCQRADASPAVSQLPNRVPSLRTPLTRWMPAASSGLRRPQSAASYASRLTAAMRTLMVPGAKPRSWRLVLYRRTTVLLKARRGSEQYQATNSSIACWYPRLESGEPRLRRTAALDISRSGIPSLVFGRPFIRLELPFGFCFMIATLLVVDHELSDSGESMSADAWLTDEPTEKPVYRTS